MSNYSLKRRDITKINMSKILLRPGHHYTIDELAKEMGLTNYDLLNFVTKHNPKRSFKDSHMVFLGADINNLLNKLVCTRPDSH